MMFLCNLNDAYFIGDEDVDGDAMKFSPCLEGLKCF